ncbi:hypothetical protein CDAR_315611 [Caerostris darwini]|uniref:Small EDRK-rich factor-like N-terminal domain-containing protein n=1 Tax=Caerostris darwini TaxID=1538125 RepID=A0AAV4TPY1_9ARAC|nr:hypothetical protein CDAR_315611 [Caerostris darwini]
MEKKKTFAARQKQTHVLSHKTQQKMLAIHPAMGVDQDVLERAQGQLKMGGKNISLLRSKHAETRVFNSQLLPTDWQFRKDYDIADCSLFPLAASPPHWDFLF